MIAEALKNEIEQYRSRSLENPMYRRAADGTLAREQVGAYLANVLHLLRHTPIHLARARERAMEKGQPDLARFFEEKIGEEAGHDAWAEQDLHNFKTKLGVHCDQEMVPALRALLDYLARTIDEDPTLYLAYILFAEYFTVLEAPQWLEVLEQRCGVPRSYMSAVANHVELDKEHVAEGLDVIDGLVTDPAYLDPMRASLRESIAHFDRFLSQVAEPSN